MKKLLIIGARGYGREIYNLAQNSIGYGVNFIIKGFLDDKEDALHGFSGYPAIISSVEAYIVEEDDVFICALGAVNDKRKYTELVLNKGGEFINIIDNSVRISTNTIIGKGCIIAEHSVVSCDIIIGDFVTIHGNVVIGHDAKIGDWCNLGSGTFFGGYSVVETMASIHTGSIIHPHKTIGSGATVGAGSVVFRNVKQGVTVYGNPAIQLKI